MDILDLEDRLKNISATGNTLNMDERLQLKLSSIKLKEIIDTEYLLFWGKINGIVNSYYIAMGIKTGAKFPVKTYYWCTSSFEFSQLPEIKKGHEGIAANISEMFSGEHEKIIVKIEGNNFTELDRLGATVRMIENECSVIPQGSTQITPIYELKPNLMFQGLTKEELVNLDMYQHFREVTSLEKKELIYRGEAFTKSDFLDSIALDLPKGAWSLQLDHSNTLAVIRSFLWPGYVAYHRCSTNNFGGAYFGNGLKNVDLPFML